MIDVAQVIRYKYFFIVALWSFFVLDANIDIEFYKFFPYNVYANKLHFGYA